MKSEKSHGGNLYCEHLHNQQDLFLRASTTFASSFDVINEATELVEKLFKVY